MNHRIALGAPLALTLLIGGVMAAGDLKSGPQAGDKLPGPFHPLNVTGRAAGQKNCLVWQNGANPVAMIFAREVSDPLTSLVKKLDAATAENKSAKMGSFVVFLSDDETLEGKLKELAEQQGLKNIVLSIDNPAGPNKYNVAKDADITVVLYNKRKVEANHAFGKGEMKDSDVEMILSELPKILPQK